MTSVGLPPHLQEVMIEEEKMQRKKNKLIITGLTPSVMYDKGGANMV